MAEKPGNSEGGGVGGLRDPVDASEASRAGASLPAALVPGEVLSDRFVVESLAGAGGMGTIHRGLDLSTRQAVAIKVMSRSSSRDASRFAEEVSVLAKLSHPAIVRYIAHGSTPQGMPFLAMEWLDGQDLSERLRRSALTVEESVSLVRRACEAMAVAHALGVVHRDVKPSNLFLVNGDPAALKVLDFGIARQEDDTRLVTRSGTVLGTVGYMSPEQAMATRDVDARTDVFALGCVLFECLAGRAAFVGSNPVAVLAKVLHEEPPQLAQLRPDLDGGLEALVAAMLAKKPEDRPNDAAAVLRALDDLGGTGQIGRAASRPSKGLTGNEQKIISMILGKPRSGIVASTEALSRECAEAEVTSIWDTTIRFEAEPVWLRNGAWLVVVSGRGAATDHAAQAARCALSLRQTRPDLVFVVATGPAETTERAPVGAVIDRAAELLAKAEEGTTGIAIDELTAALLDPGFDVNRENGDLVLIGQHGDFQAIRLLMGKPTPFVGRERELGLLELTLRECVDESVARVVLVTGAPGQGKSRLRHEFVDRVRARGGVSIFMARADPVGAGSALTLLRQLVRHAMGLREGDPSLDQRSTLRARVAEVCQGTQSGRIADFLGELVGAAPSDIASPPFRAARNDPHIMGTWLRRSVSEWLAAECAARPLLLVLEDLHWGDVSSVTYLSDVLCERVTIPVMVLALARPTVHEVLPGLLTQTDKIEVVLRRLTPRAAERLVRESLGEKAAPDRVSRIVDHADGNAFYLEELIRHFAAGGGEELPETVLALVQSRLERLDPEARRMMRGASVFGDVFWSGGVAAVLGGPTSPREVDRGLRALLEHELFGMTDESGFPGETEYRFRHSLLRDAAYAMLVDADRTTGHRLAGDWLEHAGEKDALALADHFQLGGEPLRAAPWLRNAAQTALDAGNVDDAVRLARRALASGVEGLERGRVQVVHAWALSARGDWRESVEANREAMDQLPPASTPWFVATAGLLLAGTFLGDMGVMGQALQSVSSISVPPEASGPYAFAICGACQALLQLGDLESTRSLLARAEALHRDPINSDPAFDMWLHLTRANLQLLSGDLGGALESGHLCRDQAEQTGSALGRSAAAMFLVQALLESGAVERLEEVAQEALSLCELSGQRALADWTILFRAFARGASGRVGEAMAAFQALLDGADHRLVTAARTGLAWSLLLSGDLDGAARESARAADSLLPTARARVLSLQALVELRFERPQEALAFADSGLEAARRAAYPSIDCTLRLVRAEALHGLGEVERARTAIGEARDYILRVAGTLRDPELRASFCSSSTRFEANARTLSLAKEWLGESTP